MSGIDSGLVRDGSKPVTDWPTIRAWVLKRDDNLCQICRLRPATDVDHIWPRRLGGLDHVQNLRAACGPCNKAKGDRVDLAAASVEELQTAIAALDQKIEALEQERTQFTNAVVVRDFADRRIYEVAIWHRAHLAARMASLDLQILRWDLLLRALDYEEQKHLPDAEVIELHPRDGVA